MPSQLTETEDPLIDGNHEIEDVGDDDDTGAGHTGEDLMKLHEEEYGFLLRDFVLGNDAKMAK